MLKKHSSLPSLCFYRDQIDGDLNEHVLDMHMQGTNNRKKSEKTFCLMWNDEASEMDLRNEDHNEEGIVVDNRIITCKKHINDISQSDTELYKTMKTGEGKPCQLIYNQLYLEKSETHDVEGVGSNSKDSDYTKSFCRHVAVELGGSVHLIENYTGKIRETNDKLKYKDETMTSTTRDDRLSLFSDISVESHCRICHCGSEEEKLITPCSCAGSLQYIHASCLAQWMQNKVMDTCELCQEKIEIAKRLKPIWRWKRPAQRPYPLICFLTFVAVIIVNISSVVKDASSGCTSTPCLIFFIVGCIGAVLSTIFMVYFAKRAGQFLRHWMRINEDWVILDRRSNHTSRTVQRDTDNEDKRQLLMISKDLTTRV